MRIHFTKVPVLLSAAALGLFGHWSEAQIVDHTAIPAINSLPQATSDSIARLRWYFIHASVGDNIMQGLRDLHGSNALQYPLLVSTIPTNSSPPDLTVPATVYEHHFTSDKMPQFQSMVNSNGWCSPAVDVALMKFCYLDGLATSLTPGPQLASRYVSLMNLLEQAHTNTIFVYVSMPLLIYRAEDDPRRDPNYIRSIININNFNQWLRAYCRTNQKLLYDLADIESHDPAGNEATFTWTNGQTYPVIYAPYVYNTNNPPGANSGHLIAPGRRQVAKGWYAVAAAIISNQTPRPRLNWTWDRQCLHFSWDSNQFSLQSNTNLTEASGWEDLPGADQGSYAFTNDYRPARFFRLKR